LNFAIGRIKIFSVWCYGCQTLRLNSTPLPPHPTPTEMPGAHGGVCWRHYTTSQNVSGSIPYEVIGFFNGPIPSTKPLTQMGTRMFLRVKCDRCIRLTSSPPTVSRLSRKWGSLNISQPYSLHNPLQDSFTVTSLTSECLVIIVYYCGTTHRFC
jgi:hypothetical protein